MIVVGCGSCGGSEVVRFRSSGAVGVLVHDGAGVTPHRWLKVAFIPSNLVKATFSHNRFAHSGQVWPRGASVAAATAVMAARALALIGWMDMSTTTKSRELAWTTPALCR